MKCIYIFHLSNKIALKILFFIILESRKKKNGNPNWSKMGKVYSGITSDCGKKCVLYVSFIKCMSMFGFNCK